MERSDNQKVILNLFVVRMFNGLAVQMFNRFAVQRVQWHRHSSAFGCLLVLISFIIQI